MSDNNTQPGVADPPSPSMIQRAWSMVRALRTSKDAEEHPENYQGKDYYQGTGAAAEEASKALPAAVMPREAIEAQRRKQQMIDKALSDQ